MIRKVIFVLFSVSLFSIANSVSSEVTVYVEPDTLYIHSQSNTLFVSLDNSVEEMSSLPFDVLFDSDCFTVTEVNRTVRSDSMDLFFFSHISGGVRIVIAGIDHSIQGGSGPVAAIIVDVEECLEGDYVWSIANCIDQYPLWYHDCNGLDSIILVIHQNDVNSDGSLDVRDIMAVINHMLRKRILSEEEFKRADWNGDSHINVLDIVGIINEILGLSNLYQDYAHGFWETVSGDTSWYPDEGIVSSTWYAIDTKSSPDSVLVTWEQGQLCPTKSGTMNDKGEFLIDDGRFPEEYSTAAEFKVLSDKKISVTFYVLIHNFVHVFKKTLMKIRDDPTVHCF